MIIEQQQMRSNIDDIILDDDQIDDHHEEIDSKFSIPFIPSSTNDLNDVILLDDD
jgi:hypothetical protein